MLPDRGLTARELAVATAELLPLLEGAELVDASGLRDRDDLLLSVRSPQRGRLALHVVPGSLRGRVCITERRFGKPEVALGPGAEAVRNHLTGARCVGITNWPGERIAAFRWQCGDGSTATLLVELFGNRGLWLLLDPQEQILALSRHVQSEGRALALGRVWVAPPPGDRREPDLQRFANLAEVDRAFTAADQAAEFRSLAELCRRTLARAVGTADARCAGLRHQLGQADEAAQLRARADLMLAYAHTVRRGATSMRVPDPTGAGDDVEIALAADKPVIAQAQAIYERARRLDAARAVAATRLGDAERELAQLTALSVRAAACEDFAQISALRDELLSRRLLRTATPAAVPSKLRGDPREAYRKFVSAEGYQILCGKSNEQNDRLTLRTARGNDVWLHVGRGHAGSHVVVRLQKGKSASLETLLDAATIAVHFSKARGALSTEVIYTLAKHVRKAKGAPAGAVIPHQAKTLVVRLDEARLQRLLTSGDDA